MHVPRRSGTFVNCIIERRIRSPDLHLGKRLDIYFFFRREWPRLLCPSNCYWKIDANLGRAFYTQIYRYIPSWIEGTNALQTGSEEGMPSRRKNCVPPQNTIGYSLQGILEEMTGGRIYYSNPREREGGRDPAKAVQVRLYHYAVLLPRMRMASEAWWWCLPCRPPQILSILTHPSSHIKRVQINFFFVLVL